MIRLGRVHDRSVLDALEAIHPTSFEGAVWRVCRKGRDPVQGSTANGRWGAAGELDVLYTSLERQGALAEVGYRLSLEPVWPSRLEHEIHEIRVTAGNTLRLANLPDLTALGVDVARYSTLEYTATQAIGAAAHFLEFDGIVVPSARFACSNLVIFLDRLLPDGRIELVKSDSVDWGVWRASRR